MFNIVRNEPFAVHQPVFLVLRLFRHFPAASEPSYPATINDKKETKKIKK
jgi:hypothetical protein